MMSQTNVPMTPSRFMLIARAATVGAGSRGLGPSALHASSPRAKDARGLSLRPGALSPRAPPLPRLPPRSAALLFALLQERRDRADDSGVALERARDDAAGVDCRLECATPHFGAERLEEGVARLGHAAGEHDDLGIEDVQQVRDARAEE